MFAADTVKNEILRREFGVKNLHRRREINEFLRSIKGGGAQVDTIIIGASVAGLSVANQLKTSVVLESRMNVGGKTRTTYDTEGRPLYDDGPWRFHESHARFKQLLDAYDVAYEENNSFRGKKDGREDGGAECLNGLSTFGSIAYKDGIEAARRQNVKSGYDGIAYGECSANVYHGQRHKAGTYYFVKGGMRKVVDALYDGCTERVRTGTMVEDVTYDFNTKLYTVHCMHSSSGKRDTVHCSKVILCAPPDKINFPSIARWLHPLFSSVETVPLMHVYAKLKKGRLPNHTYIVNPSTSNAQIISGDHSDFFQLSYTGGRTAYYMHNLYLNHRDKFTEVLRKNFYTQFSKETYELDADSISVRYWDQAVHFYRPILRISGKTIQDLCNQSIEPHPLMLPNFYVCGETFSTHQGWLEGALETSEMVLQRMKDPKPPRATGIGKECVGVDGRIINVGAFKKIHPGSEQALQPYLGQDASTKFKSIGHPKYASAYLFHLQQGFYDMF